MLMNDCACAPGAKNIAAMATADAINLEFMKTILRLFWPGNWTGSGSGSSRPISLKDAPDIRRQGSCHGYPRKRCLGANYNDRGLPKTAVIFCRQKSCALRHCCPSEEKAEDDTQAANIAGRQATQVLTRGADQILHRQGISSPKAHEMDGLIRRAGSGPLNLDDLLKFYSCRRL